MRILVAFASRHGGTEGIADAVGATLREAPEDRERHVDVLSAAEVDDVTGYDAVVVGSAVYVGRWLEPARRLVLANAAALRARPVWLFSSGPVGDPAVPATEAAEAPGLTELVGAQGHRTFPGRLRTAELGTVERATIRLVHAVEGDYRDWSDIRAWAQDIADSLVGGTVPLPRPRSMPVTGPLVSG